MEKRIYELPEKEQAVLWATVCYEQQMAKMRDFEVKPDVSKKETWREQMKNATMSMSCNRMVVNEIKDYLALAVGVTMTLDELLETLDSLHAKNLCKKYPQLSPEQAVQLTASVKTACEKAGISIDAPERDPREGIVVDFPFIRFVKFPEIGAADLKIGDF